MKILITTGIFKPELGGPATLALELSKRLAAAGHEVTVVTYSEKAEYPFDTELPFPVIRVVRSGNKLRNYLAYFNTVRKVMKSHKVIYTLDWFSAGVPVALAAKLLGKQYIARVGGGYIWEKYLSEGNEPVTLREFYARGLHKKYRIMFWLIRYVLEQAAYVVFNSDEQRTLYTEVYQLAPEKTRTIYNAIPENRLSGLVHSYNTSSFDRDKEIVFAGRFIKMKNVESLIKAFAKLTDQSFKLVLIGDGPLAPDLKKLVAELGITDRVEFIPPMSQSDLYYRIARCYVVVIPSWTDVSPHQVYECLALGIPFLLTQENYLSINDQKFLKINPHSVDDIAEKLNNLLDPETYKKFVSELQALKFNNPWPKVVDAHLHIFVALNRM